MSITTEDRNGDENQGQRTQRWPPAGALRFYLSQHRTFDFKLQSVCNALSHNPVSSVGSVLLQVLLSPAKGFWAQWSFY